MNPVARSRFVRASKRTPCPVCGRADWPCGVLESGAVAVCRTSSARRTKDGSAYVHVLRDGWPEPVAAPPPRRPQPSLVEPAPIERCHVVYSALLRDHLTLSARHQSDLLRRGLSPAAAARGLYRSAPADGDAIRLTGSLANRYDLRGVPGFYARGGGWQLVRMRAGYFIPARDERGMIQALSYRLDEPLNGGKAKYLWLSTDPAKGYEQGASSGAPAHFARADLLAGAREVVVTEGGLKADLIAYFTQAPVVGLAGTSAVPDGFTSTLRAAAPRLRRVLVAFDKDLFLKDEVFAALERLTKRLQGAGFEVRVRTWPGDAKGYDDFLLSQIRRSEAAA